MEWVLQSQSSRVKKSHRLKELEETTRNPFVCLLIIPKPLPAGKQLSSGAEGMVTLSPTTPPFTSSSCGPHLSPNLVLLTHHPLSSTPLGQIEQMGPD